LTGNGPAPVELLEIDRDAVFTFPDNTQNILYFVGGQANAKLTDTASLQANIYYRYLKRDTLNGDEQDLEDCTGIGGAPGTLCEDAGEPDEEQILDLNGNPIPTTAGGNGAFNSSVTKSDSVGGSVQTTITEDILGLDNHFVLGLAIDAAWVDFRNRSEVGALTPNRTVIGSGFFVAGDEFNTDVDVQNFFLGVYFSNTLSITNDLSVTLAGRFNHANIEIDDNLGTELTGDHTFNRFNPAAGIAYQIANNVTAYANYSESNRAPSAAELGCADPAEPCRFPNAFVADPPLDDVVTRSVEAGFRGRFFQAEDDFLLNWSVAGFASRNSDDIIFVGTGTPIGAGFFENVGDTQRLGVEVGLNGRWGPVSWYANYSFVDATFQDDFTVASPGHPNADADGLIQVRDGNRIPGIPQHSAKIGVGVNITDAWFLGVETIINSDQFLRGDESNELDTVDGYAIVNLHTSYRVVQFGNPRKKLVAFLRVNNLFNAEYETFGVVAESPEEVLEVSGFTGLTNPIFLSPGAPIGIFGGLQFIF
jgi:outer membrane receptor protein involved in Fe transport